MPLTRFLVLLGAVFLAAAVTVWLGATLGSILGAPLVGWPVAIPPLLVAIVLARVVYDRWSERPNARRAED